MLDVDADAHGVIEIGDRAVFQNRVRLQPFGGTIRLGFNVAVRDDAEIKSRGEFVTGARVVIGRGATLHCHERVTIGDAVAIAEGVNLMDSDHVHDGTDTPFRDQPIVASPVEIEDNVLVATKSLVLRGSHVGRNAVIATGSVLTGRDYPAGHLIAGNPPGPPPLTAEDED